MRKMKMLFFSVLILTLVFGLCLSSCEEEKSEYGLLTINNLPSVPPGGASQHYWEGRVFFDVDINYSDEPNYYLSTGTSRVATFLNPNGSISHTSPFSLMDSVNYGGFLRSGSFLVIIFPTASWGNSEYDQYNAFMYVTFNKGKATIDYNDMTRWDSLPNR